MNNNIQQISRLDFPGIQSKKFNLASRKHIHVQDTLADGLFAAELKNQSRRHFTFGETAVMKYKPATRIFEHNQNSSQINFNDNEQETLKKLVYMPPQKRLKKTTFGVVLKPLFTQNKIKMSQPEKEEFERNLQDRKAVEELDLWENHYAQKK